jgi:hypothetical protein
MSLPDGLLQPAEPSVSDLIDEKYDNTPNDLCCSFLSKYLLDSGFGHGSGAER